MTTITRILAALALFGAIVTSGAHAQSTTPAPAADAAAIPPTPATADATALQSDGEVRRIDREQGKLTLRHGPLPNLEMPAMTMVFKAADPRQLDGLKEGDKVRFSAERINGVYTVTAIQVLP